MKARVTTSGEPNLVPGQVVTGTLAVRLCAAGSAVPVIEKRETAVAAKIANEAR